MESNDISDWLQTKSDTQYFFWEIKNNHRGVKITIVAWLFQFKKSEIISTRDCQSQTFCFFCFLDWKWKHFYALDIFKNIYLKKQLPFLSTYKPLTQHHGFWLVTCWVETLQYRLSLQPRPTHVESCGTWWGCCWPVPPVGKASHIPDKIIPDMYDYVI